MFVSLSVQVLLNVEAMNMVESIGNYVRHRRAPVVLEVEDKGGGAAKYVIRYVPALSGECLAHAYQELLASLAEKRGLPVCPACRRGEFVKHADESMFSGEKWESEVLNVLKDNKLSTMVKLERVEELIVKNCVVEDVGGFMYAGRAGPPVKRTSRVQFSYALPVLDAVKEGAAAAEPQFHVRHVPTRPEQGAQMIYYVETGSALYTFSAALDVDGIGRLSLVKVRDVEGVDRKPRIEASIEALSILVCNALFGAKRSRFTPLWKVVSLVAAVSHPLPFLVSPGHGYDYITETCRRASRYTSILSGYKESVKVFYYNSSKAVKVDREAAKEVGAVECSSPEEVFKKVLEEVLGGVAKP